MGNGLSRNKFFTSTSFISIIVFIIIVFSFLEIQAQTETETVNQAPTAQITTTSPQAVFVGSTISLDASNSSDPESQSLFYEWSFVEKPSFSLTSFTTPSPSQPSFQIDQAGFYVVQLKVSDGFLLSEPKFLVISAIQTTGEAILPSENYSTPLICAVTAGFTGCKEVSKSFATTAGDYILNITNHSAKRVSLTLNSESIHLPSSLRGGSQLLSIPVTLLAQNTLKIKVEGNIGSSVDLEIVRPGELTDNNSSPVVSDLTLETSTRSATGTLSISDSDVGQTHSSNLLNFSENGVALLLLNSFSYTAFPGFKGSDVFYVLTRDDGSPQKGVVSKATVSINFNTAPQLASHRSFHLPKGSSSFIINLFPGTDLENDSLTYTIVQAPSHGTLSNCLGGTDDLICDYIPPADFSGNVMLTYKANDGSLDSGTSTVLLRVISTNSTITQIALGWRHSCALFNEGNIRCWGENNFGELGLGHRNIIGDNEHPFSQGDVNVGEKVLKLALGYYFTCALLASRNVKCWGYNGLGQLGLGHRTNTNDNMPFSQSSIDFGTTASVVDIAVGRYHSCALFETGQVKCWGRNNYGQLGYAHTQEIGDAEKLDEVDFVDVGARVISLSLGTEHTCALLEGGSVKCWGYNYYGALGLGHRNNIGDNEAPSSISSINLGGQALEITSGDSFSCARLTTGNVKCWGRNGYGRLGQGRYGDIGDDETPESIGTISLGSTVSQVSSGSGFSCVILDSGHVRCWGENTYGQLGLGHRRSIGYNEVPSTEKVLDLPERVAQVATGNYHACAVLQSGRLMCWGNNRYGLLGLAHENRIGDNETLEDIPSVIIGGNLASIYPRFSFAPMDSRTPSTIRFDASHSFAKHSITSYSWNFGNGEMGTGVTAMTSFSVSKSYNVSLTITDELGHTSSLEKIVMVQPPNNPPVMPQNQRWTLEQGKISVINLPSATDREGNSLTYSLVNRPSQGTLTDCLNNNEDLFCKYTAPIDFTGEVTFSYKANDGTSDSFNTTDVELNIVPPKQLSILKVSSSSSHSCALFSNKKIKCWGYNIYGQLGLGHTNNIGDNERLSSQDFVNVGGNVLQVSTGNSHTCVLLENKRVKCWGDNSYGQLGLGHRSRILDPSSIEALNLGFPVKQIASGDNFNCVLGESGQVKCWGSNYYGQLGYGHTNRIGDSPEETSFRIPFVKVGSAIKKLSLGFSHTCTLLEDKTVKCWGYNGNGELGLGHTRNIGDDEELLSVGVLSLGQGVLDISVGDTHNCVLLEDKNVRCWGLNGGVLGLGHRYSIGDDELPSSVAALDFTENVKKVFAGGRHTCALLQNKSAKCWGSSNFGALGYPFNSDITNIAHARTLDFEAPVIDMSLGTSHTCVLLSTGDLRCFGRNYVGQLGLGHTRNIGDDEFISERNSSVFSEQRNVVVAGFDYSVSEINSKVITFDASLSFARNSIKSYQWNFGNGSTSTIVNPTHTFSRLGSFNVTLIVTDNSDQTAMTSRNIEIQRDNKSPYFEGSQKLTLEKSKTHTIHLKGALDFDSTALTYTIVQAPTQGTLSGCLTSTNDLTCSYQVPSSFTGEVQFSYKANDGNSDSEVTVVTVNIVETPSSILQIASGRDHTCALYENKKIKCWGYNGFGQLGLGHTHVIGDNESPVSQGFVDVGSDVLQVSLGEYHTCALLEDKSVKCWGYNSNGQLGLGHRNSIGDDEKPSSISSLNLGESIRQIVTGHRFTCALTESGKVKCWGANNYGQLGLGHTNTIGDQEGETSSSFSSVNLGSRAMKLSSGHSHICTLLQEGRVRCWGLNNIGQLGYGHVENIGDDEHPFVSGNVSVGQKVLDIALGYYHTCTLLEDKSVKCWGNNGSGQLGQGYSSSHIGDNEYPSSIGSINLGSTAKSIYAGYYFSCALMESDELKCWGSNGSGQFGLGRTRSDYNSVTTVPIGGDIIYLSLGAYHIYVLFKDGSIRSWGENNRGQLGFGHTQNIGDDESITLPDPPILGGEGSPLIARFTYGSDTRVSNTINFDASDSYSDSSISSYSWNFGDMSATQTGQKVSHTFIASGSYTVTLTVTDSSNQTDTFSQVLKIKMSNRPPFFSVPSQAFHTHLSETTAIELMSAKDSDGNPLTYTLVRSPARGTLSNCLGGTTDLICDYVPDLNSRENVQFTYKANDGTLDSEEVFTVFLDVKLPRSPIIQISLGREYTCVLFQNKKVSCWGRNYYGQLGLGHTEDIGDTEAPLFRDYAHVGEQESVNVGGNVLQISSGSFHTCALLESGDIRCWGGNYWGQLGLGHRNTIGDNEQPASINALNFGQKVIQVSATGTHTCVLLENGGVRCWGYNDNGELGLGYSDQHLGDDETLSGLMDLDLGKKAVYINAGFRHSCAILIDGKMKCWGDNSGGQLGLGHTHYIGDNETLSNLQAVELPESVLRVSLGTSLTCTLFESRNMKCWGYGSYIGRGNSQSSIGDDETPLALSHLVLGGNVYKTVSNSYSTCVILEGGSVKCWGSNSYGQLGLGSSDISWQYTAANATSILLNGKAVDISSGNDFHCALLNDGKVQCWGQNQYGQLGLGHRDLIGDDEVPTQRTLIEGSGFNLIARFNFNYVLGLTNQSISFDASNSYSTSEISTYSWNFGDSSAAQTGKKVTHTFTTAGTYDVTLTVTDSNSKTHSVSKKITILQAESDDSNNDDGENSEDNDNSIFDDYEEDIDKSREIENENLDDNTD